MPIPGIALLSEGTFDWMVRPETLEDVIQYDSIPSRLIKKMPARL